jgi:hypothetical protein
MFVEKYSSTECKKGKSIIASNMVAMTREKGGCFCKYEHGAWFEVGDYFAREKVCAMFRDMLHTQYRSSAKAKTARRRVQMKRKKTQAQQCGQQLLSDDSAGHSDDSSRPSSCSGSCRRDSLGFDHTLELDFFDVNVF